MPNYYEKLKFLDVVVKFCERYGKDKVEIERSDTRVLIKIKKDAEPRRGFEGN